MKFWVASLLCALALAAACGVHHTAPTPSIAATLQASRNAVEAAMHAYAVDLQRGTPEAVAQHFTSEGELVLPGIAPLQGREAIRAFLKPLVATVEVISVEIDTDTLTVDGPRAEQRGAYKQIAGERGQPPQPYHGKYQAEWRLESDQQWRLARLTMLPD